MSKFNTDAEFTAARARTVKGRGGTGRGTEKRGELAWSDNYVPVQSIQAGGSTIDLSEERHADLGLASRVVDNGAQMSCSD